MAEPTTATSSSTDGSPSPTAELLLPRVRPRGQPFWTRMPVFKTVFYTLDISARFLLNLVVGKGTIACADRLIDGYWRRILQSGNADMWVEGRSHFAPGQPFIVMSNHGSLLDIPALMGAVPTSLRMVLKQELTWLPVWGQALVASGFIPINRKNRAQAIAQLQKAKVMLSKGVTVWISPEGTRARDAKLAPFKRGGFHLASDLGVPIIPAYIEGAQHILPPDQLSVQTDCTLVVRFGAPIPTTGVEVPTLMAQVRAAILTLSKRAGEIDGEAP
jgi:1-acyl-sn-glycerol-3-phosphate acyltransferase